MNSEKRLVDANINRACEGLRVIEDVARLHLGEAELTVNFKEKRHALRRLFPWSFLFHRDSVNDCGKDSCLETELQRKGIRDVVLASFKRAEEAVRVLEEMSKLSHEGSVDKLKEIRFFLYEMEPYFLDKLLFPRKDGLREPLVYFVLSLDHCDQKNSEKIAIEALKGGVGVLQLRSKVLSDRDLLIHGRKIRDLCETCEVPFIVDDRPDLAILLRADGLHVGQDDLPISEVRDLVGDKMILGLSCHSLDQLKALNSAQVDYAGYGPIFPTRTKVDHEPVVGAAAWENTYSVVCPTIAIGGISLENVSELRKLGCRRIAVSSGITNTFNIQDTVKRYLQILHGER